MQQNYIFESGWIPVSTPPKSGDRCIITDGELVVFSTYISDLDSQARWIIPELQASPETFKVIGWMPSPKPMKKTVVYNEKPAETPKGQS